MLGTCCTPPASGIKRVSSMPRVSGVGPLQAHPAEPDVPGLCLLMALLCPSASLFVDRCSACPCTRKCRDTGPCSLLVLLGKLVVALCSSRWWLSGQAFAGVLAGGFAREGNGAAEAADAQAAAAAAVEHAARQAQVDREDPIYQARACTCPGPSGRAFKRTAACCCLLCLSC